MNYQPQYKLANCTTFCIGGPADYFASVTDLSELKKALDFAKEKSLPVLVLGRGSNILISDKGFQGLVIQNQIKGIKIDDSGLVVVGAGENLDDVVARTIEKGLAGIESLSGVPGSAGGAVVQNVGAYGQTLGDVVLEVKTIEIDSGKEKIFSAEECEFGYRSSWFKKNLNKYIVTEVRLKLNPNGEPVTTYAHVQKHFENKPKPSLSELREFIIKIRASKGYLIMPGIESYKTAGSFFKNPIVSLEQFEILKPVLGDPSLNRFWEASNGVKIAAAFLMEEAGFGKGYREGNVGISPKHSLSLVNFGGATAEEIKALAEKIKSVVFEKFSVRLEEEVLYV